VAEAATGGATVILASHELERATGLATRRLLVVGGRVTDGVLAPDPDPDPERPRADVVA